MREIKFRAWEKEMKRMFTFEELDNATGGLVKIGNKALKEEFGEDMKLNPGGLFIPTKDENMILMQYTGLKDKNGKEIYEGDIVRTPFINDDSEYENHIVIYDRGCFCIDYSVDYHPLLNEINEVCKVICSIYDDQRYFKGEYNEQAN